jgi:glycosyltransferase involved in cell wall biosynthesis
MMPAPRISILLPFRNAAPWLQECLESIRTQTYSDYEAILINDHSEDDSFAIARAFSLQDERFKLYKNRGKGLVSANATALEASCGSLITRMDADDVMPPEKLEKLSEPLRQSGPGYLSTALVSFFSAGSLGIGTRFYENWLNERCNMHDHWDWIWRECVIPSPCWMAHRTDLLRVNAFDSEVYPDDYELCFRFYAAGLQLIPVNQVLHWWRQHAQRMSKQHSGFATEAFLRLKWHWFRKRYPAGENRLFVLGHGKKTRLLIRLLEAEGSSFTWLADQPQAVGNIVMGHRLQAAEAHTAEAGDIMLSFLSSIDNHEALYSRLAGMGWAMHQNLLRWC